MPVATILAVEDDPLQIDMLDIILTRRDMTLLRASTGEAALELYRQHTEIDLILLDVMLPGRLDGLAVCRQVRADQHRLYVPIIIVTALGTPSSLCKAWMPAPMTTLPSRSVRGN
jgi:CheY-like chemotaxis protein